MRVRGGVAPLPQLVVDPSAVGGVDDIPNDLTPIAGATREEHNPCQGTERARLEGKCAVAPKNT